jgi:carbamoyl-phosphate synthase small subunit
LDRDSLIRKAIESPDMEGSDYVKAVSVKEPFDWNPGFEGKYRVVAMDYGIKYNILRLLEEAGCKVVVMPATATFEEIMAQEPDGIFLSNGPGDPDALPYVYPAIRDMLDKKPVFGICLGHQVLGIALGGKTFKLKFGHRGGNQPVKYAENGRVEISAQNHGFAVDLDSLDSSKIEVTHMNLNDRTVEGLQHKELPVFSVQYHPEASPGPHDSRYLFEKFVNLMESHKAK